MQAAAPIQTQAIDPGKYKASKLHAYMIVIAVLML
jgi:hypothetical protein